MKKITIENFVKYKDFLMLQKKNINIIFSTAEDGRSFNRHTEEGREELNSLISDFDVSSIKYLQQVHSDTIYVANNKEDFNDNEGDALITNSKNTAIGVFTADCVPVIIVDEENLVVAAIHSGWKGTFNSIVKKTVEKICAEFGSKIENIKVYIGPHIRQCCYEVSEELKDNFISKTGIAEDVLFSGRKLSMENCIQNDLLKIGVNDDNIYTLDLCTYCSDEVKLHSYRKAEGTYGRLFSFVIIK